MTLSAIICSRRIAKGWSQGQLASRTGTHASTISKLEAGGTAVFETVLTILLVLEFDVGELTKLDLEQKPTRVYAQEFRAPEELFS